MADPMVSPDEALASIESMTKQCSVMDSPAQARSIQRAQKKRVVGGRPENQTTNVYQQRPPIPSEASHEHITIKTCRRSILECQPPGSDTKLPPQVDISATKATTLPTSGQQVETSAQPSSVWTFMWLLIYVIGIPATAVIYLTQKLWMILRLARKYWWLVVLCSLVWPRSTTDIISALKGDNLSTFWSSPSLNSPSGTMVRSLTSFAKTLEINSGMYPVPSLMHNAELDILMLNRQVDHPDLASVEYLQRLCLEYIELSQSISDNLDELLFLHIAGGNKLVIIAKAVTEWLERIAIEDRQRLFITSLLNYARGYDESRFSASKVYDYLFPETIAVLERMLGLLDGLVKEIRVLKSLIENMQVHIRQDGSDTGKKHAKLRKSILWSLGFYGTRHQRSEDQLKMLGNLTALITIPEKYLTEIQQILKQTKADFVKLRTNPDTKLPTEFDQMVSMSELIDELKVGSQAIADALDHIEKESALYTASIYDDTANRTTTSMPKRGQRTIGT
ncbi:hypothetical protein MMC17_006197 [Xylographa soralifera]|nr:hypothetical protein [Xylographa soralifera]